MTPGAQIAAAIALLEIIDEPHAAPADKILADWNRNNRYAGSKDRNAIARLFYANLRHRSQLDWWLQKCKGSPGHYRHRMIIWLVLGEQKTLKEIQDFFTGERYDPKPLSSGETRIISEIEGSTLAHEDQSAMTMSNTPEWLEHKLTELYGENTTAEMTAFCAEAPVDLRVNTLKADLPEAKSALKKEGIETKQSPLSPLGLRLKRRRPLSGTEAFKNGLVEVQDEGSQLAAILADTKPGHKVVDFCAGAGGKSLAMGGCYEK